VLVAIATHGAHFLALRSHGPVNERARRIGRLGAYLLPVLAVCAVLLLRLARRSEVV